MAFGGPAHTHLPLMLRPSSLKDACTRCPHLAAITGVAHGFTDLVRNRRGAHL